MQTGYVQNATLAILRRSPNSQRLGSRAAPLRLFLVGHLVEKFAQPGEIAPEVQVNFALVRRPSRGAYRFLFRDSSSWSWPSSMSSAVDISCSYLFPYPAARTASEMSVSSFENQSGRAPFAASSISWAMSNGESGPAPQPQYVGAFSRFLFSVAVAR